MYDGEGSLMPARLTLGTGEDGLGAQLVLGEEPPVAGRLDPAALAATRFVHTSSTNDTWTSAEWQGAARVAALLDTPGMAELRASLLAARAANGARPFPLAVDARTEPLRAVPWELLQALSPADHPLAGLRVRRSFPTGPTAPSERGLQVLVLVWAPETGDPRLAPLLADLTRALSGLRRIGIRALPGDLSTLPPPPPGVPRVLHVLTLGGGVDGAVARLCAAEGAAANLAKTSQLVVLDAVDAPEDRPSPAPRLLAAGAPLVVAPRRGLAADASRAFHRALYGALAAGRSVANATEEGRRALQALGLPLSGGRWWSPTLLVGPPEAADRALLRPASLPKGWPVGSTDGEAVFASALEHARGQGYLGVEHVALALSEWEPASDVLGAARHALVMVAGTLPGVEGADPPVPSPRLEEAVTTLAPGYDPDALLRMLATIGWVAERLGIAILARLHTGAGRRSLPPASSRPPQGLGALAFEVLAGPDDGRRFVFDLAGQFIGRWDADTPGDDSRRLFVGGRAIDRSVSRRHLVYLGGREVEVLGFTRLERSGRVEEVKGRLEILPGDRLWLGAGTRLQA